MGFVVDVVGLGQVFLPVLRFSPVSIIPTLLHAHVFAFHQRHIISVAGTDVNQTLLVLTLLVL